MAGCLFILHHIFQNTLFYNSPSSLAIFNKQLLLDTKVTSLDARAKTVTYENKGGAASVSFDFCVIASGAR
jgi:NADPH-dependent 2,4-dienoyl-CoA reductase/sulfur reductase-like enzyme